MGDTVEKRRETPGAPILIVDDNPDVRDALAAFLEMSGYATLGAENGRDALDTLRDARERPCLILLDLNMPVMNGFEFRECQLADPVVSHIPTVVVSANDRLPRLATVPFDGFVRKPVDPTTLLTVVERHAA